MTVDLLSYVSPFKLDWYFQSYRDLNDDWHGFTLAIDGSIKHATPVAVFKNQADVLLNVLEDMRRKR